MGCKSKTHTQINDTLSLQNFSVDKMYDEDYSLQQIHHIFSKLVKNWKTLNHKHASLLEEIHEYLEENYYICCVCGVYFEDHTFTNPNYTRHECYSCFTESNF